MFMAYRISAIVSAPELFPPLNSFRTCKYCDQRSDYIRLNSKKNSFQNHLKQSFLENFQPYSRPFLEDYMTSLYNGILEGELKEARKINPICVAQ